MSITYKIYLIYCSLWRDADVNQAQHIVRCQGSHLPGMLWDRNGDPNGLSETIRGELSRGGQLLR